MKAQTQAFCIVVLGLAGISAPTAYAISLSDSFAGDFGGIAGQAMVATSVFIASIVGLPRLIGRPPVIGALIGALILIALTLLQYFWLDDFIRGLL